MVLATTGMRPMEKTIIRAAGELLVACRNGWEWLVRREAYFFDAC
jgi:hypothetical protein